MPDLHPQSQHDAGQREQLADLLEEIIQRIEAGHSVDLDQYKRQYPELAQQLQKLVPAVAVLEGLGRSASQRVHAETPTVSHLGDFRIIREIGRGGMGTVYEAHQLSMDRCVALKVLPFAALLGDRQLLRFKNEARTAGTLHHAHIVPVYSVGVERGVHYYAMQFIEGPSLAEVLVDLRAEVAAGARDVSSEPSDLPPTTGSTESVTALAAAEMQESTNNSIIDTRRELHALLSTARSSSSERAYFEMITQWGTQACEALAHAHESGVLHRDIKPGNLLVDERGELWITDFGLARLEKDASMTTSGDIVGTLRYMAPEQALGKRVLIDHRADIYSLGATLYELLTFQPAFSGEDREELLQAVAYHDPVPLRKHDANIPSDLETIVLKALEKRPEDRYLTAEEMADDLKRFLDDKPIQAKPASLLQHAAKWSRRHVAVVWSLVFVFLTASVLMGIATAAVMRERSRTKAALERAETSAQLAKDAVDDMYVNFAEEWISNQLGLSDTERSFLEKAADFYAQIPVDLEASPTAQVDAAKTLRHLAAAREKLGQKREAKDAIDDAIAILEALHTRSPASRTIESRRELAECYYSLATPVRRGTKRSDVDFAQRAMREFEQLCAEDSDDSELSCRLALAKRLLAHHHHNLREFDLADQLFAEAHAQIQELVDSSPDNLEFLIGLHRVVQSRAISNLIDSRSVIVATRDGRSDEARRLYLLSLDLAQQIAEKSPGNLRHRFATIAGDAIFYVNSEEAVEVLRRSEEQLKALVQQDPARLDFKHRLRLIYHQLSEPLARLGRHEEFVEARKLDIALRDEPSSWDFEGLAESLGKLDRWQEAREAIDEAILIRRETEGKLTVRETEGENLGQLLLFRAECCRQLGDSGAAKVAELERQEWISSRMAELTKTIEQQPTDHAYFDRAELYEQTDQPEKALADYTQCIARESISIRFAAHRKRADLLTQMFRYEEALEAVQQALSIRPHEITNWQRTYRTLDDHDLCAIRGVLLSKLDRDQEALRDFNTVLEGTWPEDHQWINGPLVFLLTCGSPKVRDPDRALELATHLLEVQRDHQSLQAAGFAYYRVGRYEEAFTALLEASDRGKLLDHQLEWTWIMLAMTKAQLGDGQEAHDLFSKAVKLLSDRAARENGANAKIRRIIHEAANLLVIDLTGTMWAEEQKDRSSGQAGVVSHD